MKKILNLRLSVLLTLCLAGAAHAQYTGPSGVPLVTVAHLLKAGTANQQVMLQGVLLRKVGHEKYDFSDSTGTIRVEIDDKIFPREPIDDKARIEIHGEIEKDFMTSPEIDVDSVRRLGAP